MASIQTQKLTVWCALCSGGVVGPYLLESDEDKTETVNWERYRRLITDYFSLEIEDIVKNCVIDISNLFVKI